MTPTSVLSVSPLLFFHPLRAGASAFDGIGRHRFRSVSLSAFQLLEFFLEPKPVGAALDAGISLTLLETAVEEGLLVEEGALGVEHANRWEASRWSRPAWLTFSQMNLDYAEPVVDISAAGELVDFRRNTVREYLKESPYPSLTLVHDSEPIILPEALEVPLKLATLLRRRSVRSFGDQPVPLLTFATILYAATHNIRTAERSRNADPVHILNSFYAWLRIFVVVQCVEGLARGTYQYDPLGHRLLRVGGSPSDAQISACIQNQTWIAGSGFCLFAVAQWERYMWVYRQSRAYIGLLIQAGEFGQEVLQAAYSYGLGGWLTPAIHESLAHDLLSLDPGREDAVYFIKLGLPKHRRPAE